MLSLQESCSMISYIICRAIRNKKQIQAESRVWEGTMGIGERIRRRRVELGFTRNELAEKVHVTPSAVANYENNISIPKLELLTGGRCQLSVCGLYF